MATLQVSGEEYSFADWIRSGRLIRADARWGAREVKFNPNHDPTNGRFTFADGGGTAGMSKPPKTSHGRRAADGSWAGGGFAGGGGGSGGGGGASGDYITTDDIRQYQLKHPGKAPYLARPGDTVESIAAEHHLTVEQLRLLNHAGAGEKVHAGQIVAIPNESLRTVKKDGYRYNIDPSDRTRTVAGDLHLVVDQKRSKRNQQEAGGADRRANDDGGHFIAARFGGPTDSFNHFAQNANFNRGAYNTLETSWAAKLKADKPVHVDIAAHYPGESKRPDRLTVVWTIAGAKQSRIFGNEPKGSHRGR